MHSLPVLALVLALGASQAFAQEQLRIGDPLPALHIKDQHDKSYEMQADTRRVLFVADNAGTALATQLIESHEADWLTRNKQVFLADIHKMPGLIASFVAIPQLQKKPYPILLGKEATELPMFPRKKDCVTVIAATDNRIVALSFACTPDELRAAGSL